MVAGDQNGSRRRREVNREAKKNEEKSLSSALLARCPASGSLPGCGLDARCVPRPEKGAAAFTKKEAVAACGRVNSSGDRWWRIRWVKEDPASREATMRETSLFPAFLAHCPANGSLPGRGLDARRVPRPEKGAVAFAKKEAVAACGRISSSGDRRWRIWWVKGDPASREAAVRETRWRRGRQGGGVKPR
ncbi:hypothetical protein Drorol1_Dr00001419 [Drosera rotundifolia]